MIKAECLINNLFYINDVHSLFMQIRDRCGHDCNVVGFTTTYAISAYHH